MMKRNLAVMKETNKMDKSKAITIKAFTEASIPINKVADILAAEHIAQQK